MKPSEQTALVRAMTVALDDEVAAESGPGRAGPFAFDGTLSGHGVGRWYYDFVPPERTSLGDAPVRVHAADRVARGWTAGTGGGRCTVALDTDLGDRAEGWVDVYGSAPLQALRDRLAALEPDPRVGRGDRRDRGARSDGFRFDQAALVLGAPGGRMKDEIARAAESTDQWSFDDREGDVLGTALRRRWSFVQPPPDGDATDMLVRLTERLLGQSASVLVVSPHAAAVDWALLALCDRLRSRDALRSGLVHRVGPIGLPALRDAHGELVDPEAVVADVREEIERQAAELDEAELLLRHEEAVARYAEAEEMHAELTERLDRARQRGRLSRLRGGDNPDELMVALHQLRPRRAAAKRTRDAIAAELSQGPTAPADPPDRAGTGQSFGARLRELGDARGRLVDARVGVEEALRRRCRLVVTTTGHAYTARLPRPSFDVVVVAGQISRPEAFFLAGLSTRSVIAVGAPRMAPVRTDPAPAYTRDRGRTGGLLRPARWSAGR